MTQKKADILTQLRTAHAQFGPTMATAAAHPDPADKSWPAPRIQDLPAYQEIATIQAAAKVLDIESPFFRQITGGSGTRVEIDGKPCVNFGSYDYLSLNTGPEMAEAVARVVSERGVSAAASRLAGGHHSYHRQLEQDLASFLGTEDAVAFVSGFVTNHSVIRSLVGPGDMVMVDQAAHASIFEGIRSSGAAHVTFPHNDHAWLETRLGDIRGNHDRVLIVVEGLYSMDGDMPDLPRFVALKQQFGAWLMVDEAHSIGTIGPTGRGICEAQGVPPGEIDVIVGTLSKAFCSCGGVAAGSAELGLLMRHVAPGFVYSVGLSAPNSVAAHTALAQLRAQPERVRRLAASSRYFREKAKSEGLDIGPDAALTDGSPIVPVLIGDSIKATSVSNALLQHGYNVLPIIAPGVPENAARLRFFVNYCHTKDDIDAVIMLTTSLLNES